MQIPKHLGGHLNKTHIDIGLIEYVKKEFNVKSAIDVGCGPGGNVEEMHKREIFCIGIDGDFSLNYRFPTIVHDFTKSKLDIRGFFDLALSTEFLEHVEEQYMDNYMPCFTHARYAIVTHAVPGQAGHHHVNCQTQEYWVDKFAEYDMIYDEGLTTDIRRASTMTKPFIARTGLVFANKRF